MILHYPKGGMLIAPDNAVRAALQSCRDAVRCRFCRDARVHLAVIRSGCASRQPITAEIMQAVIVLDCLIALVDAEREQHARADDEAVANRFAIARTVRRLEQRLRDHAAQQERSA